ncbi:hypothetical protein D6745_01865 [Candidatus Woesearchaeota archaeon]|nr:MAG: hypothetical protein D6745_01865 [Candidatus Woesearchaeota archaeon]
MGENKYAAAGVDFEKEHEVVGVFKALYLKTRHFVADLEEIGIRFPEDIGSFSDGVNFDLDEISQNGINGFELYKAMDGAGTKPMVHQLYRNLGGRNPGALGCTGFDAVAMVANDLVCSGARPFMITNYVAWNKPDIEFARDLATGLFIGAQHARAAVIGGENASLSRMIRGMADRVKGDYVEGVGYDICADANGIKFPSYPPWFNGSNIQPGDEIIGLRSSGIHCNGISLAREVLINYPPAGWNGLFKPTESLLEFGGKTVLEEILTPTKIYVPIILGLLENPEIEIRGIANITGEGVANLNRVLKERELGAFLDFRAVEPPHTIFQLIQDAANIKMDEMYRDFNMGWGMYVVVPKGKSYLVLEESKRKGFCAEVLGEVTDEKGISIVPHNWC